jgi:hypothetical protein
MGVALSRSAIGRTKTTKEKSMQRSSVALTIAVLISGAGAVLADEYVSPGKTSAFVAHQGVDSCCEIQPTLTIERGLPRRVLEVHATFSADVNLSDPSVCPNQPKSVVLFPIVNGVSMEPTELGLITANNNCAPCNDAFCLRGCSTSGNFWLDLDKAEIEHPGVFMGQPLRVVLIARAFGNGGACKMLTSASMSATLLKK